MVYFKGILLFFIKFVICISDYFEYYEVLEYDEWCVMFLDIFKDIVGYKELCNIILKMYEEILVFFKRR